MFGISTKNRCTGLVKNFIFQTIFLNDWELFNIAILELRMRLTVILRSGASMDYLI